MREHLQGLRDAEEHQRQQELRRQAAEAQRLEQERQAREARASGPRTPGARRRQSGARWSRIVCRLWSLGTRVRPSKARNSKRACAR